MRDLTFALCAASLLCLGACDDGSSDEPDACVACPRDGGSSTTDSGSARPDSGTSAMDSGAGEDAGSEGTDSGSETADAGTEGDDAGSMMDAGIETSDAAVGTECTFNSECAADQRCDCADFPCTCQVGERGTNAIGESCSDAHDCASSVCFDDLYCTDACDGPSDCPASAPSCEFRSFLGEVCIKTDGGV